MAAAVEHDDGDAGSRTASIWLRRARVVGVFVLICPSLIASLTQLGSCASPPTPRDVRVEQKCNSSGGLLGFQVSSPGSAYDGLLITPSNSTRLRCADDANGWRLELPSRPSGMCETPYFNASVAFLALGFVCFVARGVAETGLLPSPFTQLELPDRNGGVFSPNGLSVIAIVLSAFANNAAANAFAFCGVGILSLNDVRCFREQAKAVHPAIT